MANIGRLIASGNTIDVIYSVNEQSNEVDISCLDKESKEKIEDVDVGKRVTLQLENGRELEMLIMKVSMGRSIELSGRISTGK